MAVKLAVAAGTDVGKVRTNNEDAFVVADLNRDSKELGAENAESFDVRDRGILVAVSDGMGGEAAGEVASALVVETLRRVLAEKAPDSAEGKAAIAKAVEDAVTTANEEVLSAAKDPSKKGMGATLTAVYVHGDTAYIAEVGDSRAYLLRGRRMRQMTKDQSFVQLLVDAGAMSEEEAKNYPHKNIILQAMGQQKNVATALGKLALRRNDRLLLCSDGLSNKVSPEEMREVICDSPSLEAACRKLIELANERGGEDNVTVVLAELSGDDLRPPQDAESVTQTFEIMKEGPGAEATKTTVPQGQARRKAAAAAAADPAAKEAAPAAEGKAGEAAPAAKKDDDDDLAIPEPTPATPEEMKSRPLQMAVAFGIMAVMVLVFYYLLKD